MLIAKRELTVYCVSKINGNMYNICGFEIVVFAAAKKRLSAALRLLSSLLLRRDCLLL